MEFSHVSVLLSESLEALNIKTDGIYVDGTAGGGGHSSQVLRRLSPQGRLVSIDRDSEALKAAEAKLHEVYEESCVTAPHPCNYMLVKSNYGDLPSVLKTLGVSAVDGILLDLGVSSYQLDNPERGFSYMKDAPLDMRMDTSESFTAADLVNGYEEAELARILREYGEERFAGLIARRIVLERSKKPLETTGELVSVIERAIPAKYRKTGGHPAKRTFQAIRIELNHELTILEDRIQSMIDCLGPGGRMAIITFHSLEDRIVKNAFRTAADPCICPKDFPVCTCGRVSKGKLITHKPILPSQEEMAVNPRSQSAKLRVFEHI